MRCNRNSSEKETNPLGARSQRRHEAGNACSWKEGRQGPGTHRCYCTVRATYSMQGASGVFQVLGERLSGNRPGGLGDSQLNVIENKPQGSVCCYFVKGLRRHATWASPALFYWNTATSTPLCGIQGCIYSLEAELQQRMNDLKSRA